MRSYWFKMFALAWVNTKHTACGAFYSVAFLGSRSPRKKTSCYWHGQSRAAFKSGMRHHDRLQTIPEPQLDAIMRVMRTTFVALFVLAPVCARAQEPGDAQAGLTIVQAQCIQCHALRPGASPRLDAPSFFVLANTPGMTGGPSPSPSRRLIRPWSILCWSVRTATTSSHTS
jgi:hypothetical protein